MPPEATVCIPWRPTPSRIAAFDCVRSYWAEHFPAWPVITADSDTAIFNLGAARNAAVRQAQTEVVVVADADTVLWPPEVLTEAVAQPDGICWPHTTWRLIPAQYAEKPVEEFPSAPVLRELPKGLGAAMVCRVDEYWRLGGQPEEFEGWGHEDVAFHCVASTLSRVRRLGAIAYSIEHNEGYEGPADSPGWTRDVERNRAALAPYRVAQGRPWLMRVVTGRETGDLVGRG